MELLNAVMIITKCEHTAQLKDLPPEARQRLANSLDEFVPSDLATIEEWNELLVCFMDAPPESDNKIAKEKLLCFLRGNEYQEQPDSINKRKWRHFKKNQ